MRQTRTRILSLFLALVMCLGLLPMTALATEDAGANTEYITIDVPGSEQPPTVYEGVTDLPGNTGTYHITFDANGGKFPDGSTTKSLPTKRVGEENLVDGYPPEPTREGYAFEGWYRNSPGEYPSVFNYNFTSNATVYANWKKNGGESTSGFTITFAPNGGTVSPTSKQTDADGRVPGGYPIPTREGYKLLGWFTDGDGYQPKEDEIWNGNQTLVAKWEVASSDICTVTFRYVNGPGTPPAPIKVVKGNPITLPKVSLKGYDLQDWVSGEWEGNTLHVTERWTDGKIVTKDVEICIWWKIMPSTEDTYNFGNDDTAFENYKITQAYFDFLTEGTSWKASMKDDYYNYTNPKTGKRWGGSCFGMSAVYCMAKGGAIDLGVFQSGATTLRALKTPRQSQNIQDLINFYMMAQSTKAGVEGKNYYLDMEQTERYRKIVSDLTSISVLGFDSSVGGHAIVAKSVEQGSDGYHIEIWDPNNPEGLGELVISPNFSNAYFTDETYGAGAYNINTVIKYIMPLSTRTKTYDAKNLQSVFGKAANVSTQSSNSGLYLLSSSTGDFSITASDGRSAVVKGGKQVSGNLKLLDGSIDGGPGDSYRFYIDVSDLDQVTITLDGKQSKVKFVSDAFMTTVTADTLSSVVVDGSSVTTTCASSSQQEITVVSDNLGNTWNMATVSGKDTGFTLATESGQLKVSSKNNVSVSVQGENVDTQKTSGKQTVTASSGGTAVLMNNLNTGTQQPSGDNPFTDVQAETYYYDAVLWAVEKKITSGTSATTFSPNNPCTRGQIVTFLWRAAGSPKPTGSANPFADVKEGTYYYDAVLWAVEKGITSGTSATTFSPDTACTRGQTVTFLWRAAGSPKAASSTNPFSDVQSGAYYYDAVLWAVEQKVTSGTSATTFVPDTTVTRGQTVTFLYRSQGK